MSGGVKGRSSGEPALVRALEELADTGPTPFELKVLRYVGVPEDRYDTYVRVEVPAGELYVARSGPVVTGAVLAAAVGTARDFEERHLAITGRSAVPGTTPAPGVRPAVRTGRARQLRIDLAGAGLTHTESAVLGAVRSIPYGQLRPLSWVWREAGLHEPAAPDPGSREGGLQGGTLRNETERHDPPRHDVPSHDAPHHNPPRHDEPSHDVPPNGAAQVTAALARNPVHLLIPCHRVTDDEGVPQDAAYGGAVGAALRAAEGISPERVHALVRTRTVFLGSDTTHIYCHPLCAHARRITPRHQVPFRSARDARRAGYRPCRSCRPVAA
ncbi:MGMT family protein [Streptomyces sp. NPDC014733]|uniref:MGMT family protein n=1 Tax=Streptomyces sp. NPDC014733 TaxID=3364885 RepID=UPI0036FCB553